MQIQDLIVEVRDADLNRVGQVDHAFLVGANFSPRASQVGVWTMTLPVEVDGVPYALCQALQEKGAGVIVWQGDEVFCSGRVDDPTTVQDLEAPEGYVTFTGTTDLAYLEDASAYPSPAVLDPTAQTRDSDDLTGAAERLVHTYVHRNIGAGAPAARRAGTPWAQLVTGLDIPGTNLGRGQTRAMTEVKFRPLLELCQDLISGTNLVLDVRQEARPEGERLVVSTREAADLTQLIRLDVQNAQLDRISSARPVPAVTQVIMATDDGTIVAATDNDLAHEWHRRIERFQAGSSGDLSDLQVQAVNAILEGKAPGTLEIAPSADIIDTVPARTLLGAMITAVVGEEEVPAQVSQVTVAVDTEGVTVAIVLGDPDGTDTDGQVGAAVDGLGSRVGALERGRRATRWTEIEGKPATFPSTWATVSGKPATFPPSAHSHTVTDVQHLNEAANGRVYFGTGPNATPAAGNTYISLSPVSDTSTTSALWVAHDGTQLLTLRKDGTLLLLNDSEWTNIRPLVTVASGWTVPELWVKRRGDTIAINCNSATVAAGAFTVGPSGNIANQVVISGMPEAFTPSVGRSQGLPTLGSGPLASFYINSNGEITLSALLPGSGPIPETAFSFGATILK